jgi:DNA-binding beta-propeller fold protein YncE
VAATADGSIVFVADYTSKTVRKVIVATRQVTTLVGYPSSSGHVDGMGLGARFTLLSYIALTSDGATAYVTDQYVVRRIDTASRTVTTLAGDSSGSVSCLASMCADGVGTSARFSTLYGITMYANDAALLVVDYSSRRIRHIDISSATVSTFAGSGTGAGSADGAAEAASFNALQGIAATPGGWLVLVSDSGYHNIRMVTPSASAPFPPISPPAAPSLPPLPSLPPTTASAAGRWVSRLAGHTSSGSSNGVGTSAQFYSPYGVALSASGTFALVAERTYNRIRHIDVTTKTVTTLAGLTSYGSTDGIGTSACSPSTCETLGMRVCRADVERRSVL